MRIDKEMKRPLTDRESAIIHKFKSGKKLEQIAEEMSLSPNTVSTYRRRALNKLNTMNIFKRKGGIGI